ncbi:MAG: diguanylate cyclase [Gemmatimonadota bacterium]|nr:diguanylate cyclase [Gemmatimonadota bacterium]
MRFEINDRCVACMACVRVCPSDAIAVEDSDVWILDDTCVRAGLCLEACPHDAVSVTGDLGRVRELLAGGSALLVLSPEAVVHFHPVTMEQLVNGAFALGFTTVQHGVMGEELVAEAYLRLWERPRWRTLIRSTCPVLVEKVRKDYPELVPYLAPVTTPAEAETAYLRQAYPDVPIVYASVCLADARNAAEAVLTFQELDRLFVERDVDLGSMPTFHRRIPGERRRHLSTPGGMPLPVLMEERQSSRRFRKFRGLAALDLIYQATVKDEIDLGFVDILPCEGCLDHPLLGPREQLFWRRQIAAGGEPPRSAQPVVDPGISVDVARTFTLDGNGRAPAAEDVQAIVRMIGTAPSGAAWDCGACGFGTCGEFAAGLLRGRAGLRQCPPYQERLAQEAQREAAVDALTGLVTYRVLRDRLTNELARSGRSGDPFAVLFMDLDGFKQVNDTFGHRAGSDVLAAVGQVLHNAVRGTDIAGRYGGDEFVILLVRTDVQGARRVAEAIRGRVEAVGRALGYGDGTIAASIGVAEYDPQVGNGGDVLERADRALYRAKALGGNRIEV